MATIGEKLVNGADLKVAYDTLDDKIDGLTPADIGALPDTTTPADIGALPITTTPADIGAVAKNGGDTVNGALFLPKSSGFYDSDGNFNIFFLNSASSSTENRLIALQCIVDNVNDTNVCRRLAFQEYSHNSSSGTIEHSETYYLPVVSSDLSTDASYYIVTTKPDSLSSAQAKKNARSNIGAASTIILTSSDITASTINTKLSVLSVGDVATIYIYSKAMSLLTGDKVNSSCYGIVYYQNADAHSYRFFVGDVDNNSLYTYRFASTIVSSAVTPGKVYRYDGTQI